MIPFGIEGFMYHLFEVPEVFRLISPESDEQAKELLRVIINLWIKQEMTKRPIEDKANQRSLLINHHRQSAWKWIDQLTKITRDYEQSSNRPRHIAILSFGPKTFYFDSPIEFRAHI